MAARDSTAVSEYRENISFKTYFRDIIKIGIMDTGGHPENDTYNYNQTKEQIDSYGFHKLINLQVIKPTYY